MSCDLFVTLLLMDFLFRLAVTHCPGKVAQYLLDMYSVMCHVGFWLSSSFRRLHGQQIIELPIKFLPLISDSLSAAS